MKRPTHIDLVLECPSCGEPRGVRLTATRDAEHEPSIGWPEAMGQLTTEALRQLLAFECPCGATDDDAAANPEHGKSKEGRVLQ